MRIDEEGNRWHEWRADSLNALFQRHAGPRGEPGRITPETVRHGEEAHERQFDARSVGFTKAELKRTKPRKWKGLANDRSAADG